LAREIELLPEEGAADWRDIRTKTRQELVSVYKFCQGWNLWWKQRSEVVYRGTLWNGIRYYAGRE